METDISKLRNGGSSRGNWRKLFDQDLMTPQMRGTPFEARTHLALDISADGKITSCRVLQSAVPADVDSRACANLSERATFAIHYITPTEATAWSANFALHWSTIPRTEYEAMMKNAPEPVAVPRRLGSYREYRPWPRLDHFSNLEIVFFPNLAAHIPKNVRRRRKTATSVDLTITAGTGLTDCQIGVSSGNVELDRAACAAAKTLTFRYSRRCKGCGESRLPLKFVWNGKKSHIQVPLPRLRLRRYAWLPERKPMARDPNDRRKAVNYNPDNILVKSPLTRSALTMIQSRNITNPSPRAKMDIDETGKVTDCAILKSSGDTNIDDRLCELFVKKARFTPATDVFGDPAAVTFKRPISLDSLIN